jgi:hypothetical protein
MAEFAKINDKAVAFSTTLLVADEQAAQISTNISGWQFTLSVIFHPNAATPPRTLRPEVLPGLVRAAFSRSTPCAAANEISVSARINSPPKNRLGYRLPT